MNSEKEKTSIYFSGNKFFILDDFNDALRDGIVIPLTNKIEELARQKKPEAIEIWINSHGGNAELCLHLCTLVEHAKNKGITVKTIVANVANSAGSILAITGTVGERYIAPEAEHLIHYGQFDGYRKTTPLQIDRTTQHYKRWNRILVAHYQKYSHVPDLEEHIKDDNFWIEASKCIKWGLADKYIDQL